MTPKITNEGYALQIQALNGVGLNFTKFVLGNGAAPSDYRILTNLMNPLEEVALSELTIKEAYAQLTGLFSNTNTTAAFEWTEVGIFCSNPSSTDDNPLDDILYAYGHYELDDDTEGAANIPAAGTETFEITLSYRIYVGELENITAVLIDSSSYVSRAELNQHLAASNPHNITAADVSLENVPNVTTNNQTPTYTEADENAALESGETLSTAFGKIARAIKSLISHISDTVVHITSDERTSWNNKSDKGHKHSTTDITSGTLSITRGGTGASTASGALDNLGAVGRKSTASYSERFNSPANKASGLYSHAEGVITTASGYASHAEGDNSIASGGNAHAEGSVTTASGSASHAEGFQAKATGVESHAEGYSAQAKGFASHAEGRETVAEGDYSHAEGYGSKSTGDYSHAEGGSTTASGNWSHAEGWSCVASSYESHAEGYQTTASELGAHSEGRGTEASGYASHAANYNTIADQACQTVVGSYNKSAEGYFIVGCGANYSSGVSRANAFRVDANGQCYAGARYNSTGADFAEMFEWADGNPENEDRRGLFVTLDGDKIRIANSGDEYVLGIVSAAPTIVGNTASEDWQGRFKTDVFGERLTEKVTIPESTDENGVTIPERTETHSILNEDYDDSKEYVPREQRKEWSAVGLVGQLVVVDDGTCKANGYCAVGANGKATQNQTGYRVMKRLDDTHIRILYRS